MKKHIKLYTLIGGLLVSLSFAHNAFADVKIFSGSACQVNNQAATGVSYSSTGIYNGSGATQWLTCPIVRDNSFNTTGMFVRGAATASTFCYMDNTRLNGTLGTWVSLNLGVSAFPAFTKLTVTASNSPYSLLCSLPNAVRLTAYETLEYADTNLN